MSSAASHAAANRGPVDMVRAARPMPQRAIGSCSADDVHAVVRWGFFAFMFAIPIEYPDRTIPLEIHTIAGSLFLLLALFQPKVCFRRPPAAFWWLACFVWVCAASVPFTEHTGDATKQIFRYVQQTLLFWVGYNLMRRASVAHAALWGFVLGCSLIAALNVLGIATRAVETDQTVRWIVFGQDANRLGGNMALALVTLMVLTFGEDLDLVRTGTIAAAGLAAILGKSLMLAGSRGAIVAVAVGILVFPLQAGNLHSRGRKLLVTLLLAAALAATIYRSESLLKRYEKTLSTGSMSGREQLFPEAWRMFLEKPVLGWGPIDNNYELGLRTAVYTIGRHYAEGRTATLEQDTQNLVLEILTSVGALGSLPVLICIALCIRAAFAARAGPYGTTAPLVLTVVVLVLSMNTNWIVSKQMWLVFAYAVASATRVASQNRAAFLRARLAARSARRSI